MNASVYAFAWSVIERLMPQASVVLFALIHVGSSLANCVSLTSSSQCCQLVYQGPCHVFSCLCDNACKRSLAICLKSRALCPLSRILSVPILSACVTMIYFEQHKNKAITTPLNQRVKEDHSYYSSGGRLK